MAEALLDIAAQQDSEALEKLATDWEESPEHAALIEQIQHIENGEPDEKEQQEDVDDKNKPVVLGNVELLSLQGGKESKAAATLRSNTVTQLF